jgi:hypothetical protein
LPKVKRRYYKTIFGHLYAGKNSLFFYKDWRKGHNKFSDAIRKVHDQGFLYTATFDLTACYDSIDHSVLGYFLQDLGIQKEFVNLLCDYLKLWTASSTEKKIYQGHGIPQGPLSSGLLSEVVLRYFDENRTEKPQSWRYFRYVDDIRFFSKKEHDLRFMLIEMDFLSKQIGLFPQSSKIEIHKVADIEKEIKSVSHPSEPIGVKISPNQAEVQKRLIELSPRFKVNNETRFKYVLGRAEPSAKLSARLLNVLNKQPHLYFSIFTYFSRYAQISKKTSIKLLELLKNNRLYPALTAAGLRSIRDRCHPDIQTDLENFARSIVDDAQFGWSPELHATAAAILLVYGRMLWKQTLEHVAQNDDWWLQSELLQHVQIDHIGNPSYESLLNELLKDKSVDVSLVAAELLSTQSLTVNSTIDKINPVAQLALRKLGLRSVRRSGFCPVSTTIQHMLGSSVNMINWKKLFGLHYNNVVSKIARLRAYYETDATALVNLLDTIHDDLLDSLFTNQVGGIGSYTHGNIGGALGSKTSRFALAFPEAYKTFNEIHQKRLESFLSHSKVKRTGKCTRYVEFNYIGKVKKRLRRAYLEIWNKWK